MQNQPTNISTLAHSPSPIADSRLPWLDFASGIMILWMIVYHAISAAWIYEVRDLWGITDASLLPDGVHAFINNEGKLEVLNPCVVFPWLHFFMPWFFYKSGQFFKKTSIKDLWKKDSQKLLKTFVIWSAVGYIFYLLFGLLNDTLTLRNATYSVVRGLFLTGNIPINVPCWFLLSLFCVRLLANIFLPMHDDKYYIWKVLLIVVVCYVVSYLFYRFNHRLLPYWIVNVFTGLCFFVFGYAMRNLEQKWWIIVPCLLIYLVGSVIGFPIVGMLSNELAVGEYLFWIPMSLGCIVAFNAICRWINQVVNVKPIEWIGKNAMTIYVVHSMVFVSVVKILEYNDIQISGSSMFCAILLAYFWVLPICCYVNLHISRKLHCNKR